MKPRRILWILVATFLIGNTADVATTALAVATGRGVEANPIIIALGGPFAPAALAVKLVLMPTLVLGIVWWFMKYLRDPASAAALLASTAVAYGSIAAHNLLISVAGRKEPYEACGLCENFYPTSELEDVSFLEAKHANVVTLRICRRCRERRFTYIQGQSWRQRLDVPRIVIFALAGMVATLNLIFGIIIGGPLGFAVALTGILSGAGVFAVGATSCTRKSCS